MSSNDVRPESAAEIMKRAGVPNMLEGRVIRLTMPPSRAAQVKAQYEQSQKTWNNKMNNYFNCLTCHAEDFPCCQQCREGTRPLLQLFRDLDRFYELVDDADFEKLKIERLKVGQKIGWYYKDDSVTHAEGPLYQGLIIARPGTEFTYDLDPEDCIVVVTDYPTEKCNPIIDWVTLGRLLNNKDLAEIVEVYPQIIREVL